ncbi:MAG: hypothetical protein AB7U44_04775 [Sulfuricurvum sp.]
MTYVTLARTKPLFYSPFDTLSQTINGTQPMELSLTDVIGIFGVGIIVFAYILLQMEKMDPKALTFSVLNSLGAFLIIVSLLYDWNFASFLMEFIWLLISLYGVLKYFKSRRIAAVNDGKED